MEAKKTAILLPHSFPLIDRQFFLSLMRMQRTFYEWVIEEQREDLLSIMAEDGYRLDDMRNNLVEKALEANQDYLLFLDTDQVFPRDMIPSMIKDLEAYPEYDAVTGIVHKKTKPFIPCIYAKQKDNGKFLAVATWEDNGYLDLVACGMGAVIIRAELFKKIKDEIGEPFFSFDDMWGEDLYFWNKAHKLGAKVLGDPRFKIGHHKHSWVGYQHYLDYNDFKKTENGFEATKEQLEKMGEEDKDIKLAKGKIKKED